MQASMTRYLYILLVLSLLAIPLNDAWAASPTVASTSTTTDTEGDTTLLNQPSGIVAGDLLLQLCGHESAGTVLTQSGGSDWTRIGGGTFGGVSRALFAKVAAGSDTLTTDGVVNGDTVCVGVRIPTGQHSVVDVSTDITLGATVTATTINPDPPNANPGVSKDYLVLVGFVLQLVPTINAYPASYVETVNTSFGGIARVALGERALTASSEDPATATLSSSQNTHSLTIMIPPAASAGMCGASMLLGVGGC